jgi:hypothetical protein
LTPLLVLFDEGEESSEALPHFQIHGEADHLHEEDAHLLVIWVKGSHHPILNAACLHELPQDESGILAVACHQMVNNLEYLHFYLVLHPRKENHYL